MYFRRWAAFAASVLALLSSQVPGSALAQPSEPEIEQARGHLGRANEHYEAGEFKLALAEFERAYLIAPNYRILYNIGQMNMQLNSYAAALAAFEKYLVDGGDEVEPDRREAVEVELASLRRKTATLTISSNVDGAEVRIDGVVVGVTPLEPVRIDAGSRSVIVTKEGRSATQAVTVHGGEGSAITLEIDTKTPPTETPPLAPPTMVLAPPPQPPPAPADRSVGAGVWVAWSVTAAFTAAAVGTGVAALSAQSDHEALLKPERKAADGEVLASRDEALGLSIATDVLIGAAVIAGGVSIYVTVIDRMEDEPALEAAFGLGALSLRGSF